MTGKVFNLIASTIVVLGLCMVAGVFAIVAIIMITIIATFHPIGTWKILTNKV